MEHITVQSKDHYHIRIYGTGHHTISKSSSPSPLVLLNLVFVFIEFRVFRLVTITITVTVIVVIVMFINIYLEASTSIWKRRASFVRQVESVGHSVVPKHCCSASSRPCTSTKTSPRSRTMVGVTEHSRKSTVCSGTPCSARTMSMSTKRYPSALDKELKRLSLVREGMRGPLRGVS